MSTKQLLLVFCSGPRQHNTVYNRVWAPLTGRCYSSDQKTRAVVEQSPIYSKDEAEASESSADDKSKGESGNSTIGARSELIKEKEPVVVHEMEEAVQSGKWYRIVPERFDFKQVGASHIPRVPKLAHGLQRVLFSPGVHCLQDPYSGVYNFDPYIRNITQPAEFDYDKLTPYITSSKDTRLMQYARDRKRRFVGSTSSMTHVLSHLYFVLSAGRQPDTSCMSMAFAEMPTGFSRSMKYPASIALRYHNGVYGIDADKSFDVEDSILSVLGKSLEKLLTSTPKEFEKYKKENSWKVKDVPEENYHYSEFGDFVLRSQLDCKDDRLPRRSFDLKTRGSLAVRMDIQNYEITKGYQVHAMQGKLQSFEREYYDMIRSAFLKYNFQTRIGNMDGIFVAYHNTARMFGFQYITRLEMDRILYGNEPTGTKAFKSILVLLGKILGSVTDMYPRKDIRITFDSAKYAWKQQQQLDMWVEVINDEAEAISHQQYVDNGIIGPGTSARKMATKKNDPFDKGPRSDPFATGVNKKSESSTEADQQQKQTEKEDLEDHEATEEIDDYELSDEMYVNTESPILKYSLHVFSTVNGQDTDEQVTVKNKDEEWHINWKLTKSRTSEDNIVREYRRLRLRQATYFERATPDTPEEELSPMIKILRRISRQNMWRNDSPKGKIIVNRSHLPKTDSTAASGEAKKSSKPSKPHRMAKARIIKGSKKWVAKKPGLKPSSSGGATVGK